MSTTMTALDVVQSEQKAAPQAPALSAADTPLAPQLRTWARRMGLGGLELTLLALVLVGLFLTPLLAFAFLHWQDGDVFSWGRRFISMQRVQILTAILVAGSFLAAGGLHFARRGAPRVALALLSLTILAAAGFATVVAIDLEAKARYGLVPGSAFHPKEKYLARRFGETLRPAAEVASAAAAPRPLAVASAGPNVERGHTLFLGTCATCHARNGEGMPGYGKDLRLSKFVAERDNEKLVAFLKEGRQPWDPLNTTRVQMPPRGGNPMLTDDCLRDVAAYVHQLQKDYKPAGDAPAPSVAGANTSGLDAAVTGEKAASTADSSTPATGAEAADDPLIARSVIQLAPTGPAGLAGAYVGQLQRPRWAAPKAAESFFAAHLLTTHLFAIEILAAAACAAGVLVSMRRTNVRANLAAPMFAVGVAWWWVTATWLALFPVAYMWA